MQRGPDSARASSAKGATVTLPQVRAAIRAAIEPGRAKSNAWFFKSGPGQYGEGDRFLGVRLPSLRRLTKEFSSLSLDRTVALLASPWHEERLLALLILDWAYGRASPGDKRRIVATYLANTRYVNNWDLVDASASQILGAHVAGRRSIALLRRLARSKSVWERRMAIIATFPLIKRGDTGPALEIATLLVDDHHDLIHKAVGWMLREVGKRDRVALEGFLARHCRTMPRTALRYAIERFPEATRRRYLRGDV